MKTECTNCKTPHEVDSSLVGQKMTCSACWKEFEIKNANLFPCPDCYALISKRAAVCPKCGAPLHSVVHTEQKNDISSERSLEIYHPSVLNYFWWILLGIFTIPFIVGIFILLYVLIEIKFTFYELTTHRVIVRRGWIAKNQDEIWIKDMRGANYKQSIWQRICGIGNVMIGTAASAGAEIIIIGVSRPAEMIKKINSLRKI